MVWVLYLLSGGWETLGEHTLLLDGAHVLLYFIVNHNIELAVLAHLLKDLVLVRAERIPQSDISLALYVICKKLDVTDEVFERFLRMPITYKILIFRGLLEVQGVHAT